LISVNRAFSVRANFLSKTKFSVVHPTDCEPHAIAGEALVDLQDSFSMTEEMGTRKALALAVTDCWSLLEKVYQFKTHSPSGRAHAG